MRANRFVSLILVITVCLSAAIQQTQAQQRISGLSKANNAGAASNANQSNLIARVWQGRRPGFSLIPSNRYARARGNVFNTIAAAMSVSPPAVLGNGTVGHLSLWTSTSPSGNSILGDSIITQLNGNIGIGVDTPGSKLSVQGMIETTLGGYKFPDGTVQTTAAVSGLEAVSHDSTLTGDGTSASPLGVSLPLVLIASAYSEAVLSVTNTAVGGGTGVLGQNTDGPGVVGISQNNDGILGLSDSSNQSIGGVRGICSPCTGVIGSGLIGVWGQNSVNSGTGVLGTGQAVGVQGEGTFGGVGIVAKGGFSAVGLIATSRDIGTCCGDGGAGVSATGGSAGQGDGGHGVIATAGDSTSGIAGNGVVATGGNFNGRGLIATGGIGPVGYGVEATGGASTGSGSTAGAGLYAKGGPSSGSNSQSGYGLFAIAGDATNGATKGRAGSFEGDVSISENLTIAGDLDVQGSKHFKIDHPLDPENKYLLHASVESSEVLNVYSGNVMTDPKGEAVVILPDWFDALNRDLRYQLTVIGTFAQAIVASEVCNNRFTIKTNAPSVKVSWQVTGVRSDAVILKHPFRAVEDKPERERGTYLTPKLFGKPEERGVEWVHNPEFLRRLNQQRLEAPQIAESKEKKAVRHRRLENSNQR